jgi:hypothetical protein
VFDGVTGNFVPGVGLLFAGIMAFTMGMTDVFFARAFAWVFTIWGALFIFYGLLDLYNIYEVTGDALIIRNPLKIWSPRRTWDWGRIVRLDVVVKRRDARERDLEMRVYYTPEGELAQEREDRAFDPQLAQLIIDRAGLKPADKGTPRTAANLPRGEKVIFSWK